MMNNRPTRGVVVREGDYAKRFAVADAMDIASALRVAPFSFSFAPANDHEDGYSYTTAHVHIHQWCCLFVR